MRTAPPAVVDGPAVESLRFGLFSVALMPDVENGRWQNGATWESEVPCDPATGYGADCDSPAGYPLSPREGQDIVEAVPFTAYGSYRCKTFSKPLDEAQARAAAHLLGWEERQVESAIMRGHLGNSPSFQGAVDVAPGTAVSIAQAVNLLEQWLAENTPGAGVLHVPRSLTGSLINAPVTRAGQHLETIVGTRVAVGGGYDMGHVGPDGTAAPDGTRWVYASGRPVVRRGAVHYTPDEGNRVDTGNNDVTVLAHRTYVVGWDCSVAAVLVAQPETAITSP